MSDSDMTSLSQVLASKIKHAHAKHVQKSVPKAKAPAVKRAKTNARKRKADAVAAVAPVEAPTKRRIPGVNHQHNPATQKARGIGQLATMFPYTRSHESPQLGVRRSFPIYASKSPLALLPYSVPSRWPERRALFARPCPENPRHGFVESRPVRTLEEALCVWQEATIADPMAECLVMDRLTGAYSAVCTDAGITYGVGHDGVTGHGAELWEVPGVQGGLRKYVNSRIGDPAQHFEGCYIEAVEDFGNMAMVQLRGGPEQLGGITDFIPKPMSVQHVIDGRPWLDDLLGWEREISKYKGKPGVAVYAPGVSLASHIAVHGFAAGFAVLADAGWYSWAHNPQTVKGTALYPQKGAAPMLFNDDWQEIARVMRLLDRLPFGGTPGEGTVANGCGFTAPVNSGLFAYTLDMTGHMAQAAIATSVATLHCMSLWGNKPHLLRLRAFGPLALFKFLSAACIGEDRHFWSQGPGQAGKSSEVNWALLDPERPKKPASDRQEVYDQALRLPLSTLVRVLKGVEADFRMGWGGETTSYKHDEDGNRTDRRRKSGSTGYGGRKWADSTEITCKLGHALQMFLASPSLAYWNQITTIYNQAVNTVHNNGYLLNKWIHEHGVMDALAMAPQAGFLNTVAMRIIVGDHPAFDERSRLSIGPWLTEHPYPLGIALPGRLREHAPEYASTSFLNKGSDAVETLNRFLARHNLWAPK